MINKFSLLVLLIFITLCSCNTSDSKLENKAEEAISNEVKIKNGIYLILNEYTDSSNIESANVIIPFSFDFLDSNTVDQPLLLEIDTAEFVRLDLAEEPSGVEQKDKRINLMLTLSNEARVQLADFTEKHLKERVAIVIGGKAVTKHKVRERIDGGRLQITRCTDNACKYLLVELKSNYKE